MTPVRFAGGAALAAVLLAGAFVFLFQGNTLSVPLSLPTLSIATDTPLSPVRQEMGTKKPPASRRAISPPVSSATPPFSPSPQIKKETFAPPAPTPQQASSSNTTGDLAKSAEKLRAALVNILCIAETPPNGQRALRSISGSGVIVSPRGFILTNAHIGQYFLLASSTSAHVHCTIRSGSPAHASYDAALAFISPQWIHKNARTLTETQPMGTGRDDIAVLAITKSVSGSPLPSSFPFIPLTQKRDVLGEPVVIGSYAAQFLSGSEIKYSLYPTLVYGSVHKLFTFSTSTIDVVSLGGTAAAQEGSSGGGALDATGNLIALITTSTITGATSERTLYALTSSYIQREYAAEAGQPLRALLTESPSRAIESFSSRAAQLASFLEQESTSKRS